jgi:SAM-dependent methyltransferase
MSDSLLRQAEHDALSTMTLHGSVVDLGGDRRAGYQHLIKGQFKLTVLNMDAKTQPDVFHDLEQPLPLESNSFDGALLINVLEHIYHDKQLLLETARVLKPGAIAVVVVPFLFPIHPSPSDFHRFTADTLEKMLVETGFSSVRVTPLGRGVWSARHLMINRLLPSPLRQIHAAVLGRLALALDWLTVALARILGRKYNPHYYPLGYMAVAGK